MQDYRQLRVDIDGALSISECEVLAEHARATSATAALEVGHYKGLSTAVLLDALPPDCAFVTIDHHNGDESCGATDVHTFSANVSNHIGERAFRPMFIDMREALTELLASQPFGFIFYDADHTAIGVQDFWLRARHLVADDCTLVYDDADWESQALLKRLAEYDGFHSIRSRPFTRSVGDKADADTYTLEIMRRGNA